MGLNWTTNFERGLYNVITHMRFNQRSVPFKKNIQKCSSGIFRKKEAGQTFCKFATLLQKKSSVWWESMMQCQKSFKTIMYSNIKCKHFPTTHSVWKHWYVLKKSISFVKEKLIIDIRRSQTFCLFLKNFSTALICYTP